MINFNLYYTREFALIKYLMNGTSIWSMFSYIDNVARNNNIFSIYEKSSVNNRTVLNRVPGIFKEIMILFKKII